MKRAEANDRNHDKKAIAAESWYLLHIFAGQYEVPTSRRRSVTLAVELAAANDRNDRTCNGIVKSLQLVYYQKWLIFGEMDHGIPNLQ